MIYEHHHMAHLATSAMLSDIRKGQATWTVNNRLSPKTTYWQGVADWPRPDNAFQDSSNGSSLAIEFKPPGHDKGEYVRGLGQAVTYLQNFEMSAMVLPHRANDGYPIAAYLADLLESKIAPRLPIAVFEYAGDPSQLTVRLALAPREGKSPSIPKRDKRVFWAYWRDLSQFEIFELLCELDRPGATYERAFRKFWSKLRSRGKALNWEQATRKPTSSEAYFYSEKINTNLSMRHIGLIDSRGCLTDAGYDLLHHGKIYGPSSISYLMKLGNLILTFGRHLELMLWIEEKQRIVPARHKKDATGFLRVLDRELEKAGIIAEAPKGMAKATFLRDEPKLWNKLGLLMKSGANSYFFPKEGYRFNWKTCIEMVNYM
ncbi:MAG: hypothetical protein V1909_02585 [Candidatus Micrarchaeota archaeon]